MGVFFQSQDAALRYAQARPYFHPAVISRLAELLALKTPLPLALDVGCGTGLSTVALKEIAQQVIGIDPSKAMLGQAQASPDVTYQVAAAEKLPFPDASISLISVGQAFHWFHRQQFYLESARVLPVGGKLVIYNHAFHHPCLTFFNERYPSPFKNQPQIENEVSFFGYQSLHRSEFHQSMTLTLEQTVSYLMSLSSVEVLLQKNKAEDIEKSLRHELQNEFNSGTVDFKSAGMIWVLEKVD